MKAHPNDLYPRQHGRIQVQRVSGRVFDMRV